MLLLSVAPLVKMISFGSALIRSATAGAVHAVRDPQAAEAEEQSDSPCLRAFSTTASDSQPYACVREWGLPKLQEIELSRQKQQLWQRQSARNRTG